MNRTKIDWCDYTVNPVKGLCPMDCKDNEGKSYCYARAMYRRFKWNPTITYDDMAWHRGNHIPPHSRVFVGSTIELFGPWVEPDTIKMILEYCEAVRSCTFIFLTKRPWELAKYNPWPDNCWVGFSATDSYDFDQKCYHMIGVEAKVKFCSMEPVLRNPAPLYTLPHLQWLIAGLRTQPLKPVPEQWIRDLISAADEAGVPLFLKSSIQKAYPELPIRQEFPSRKATP